MAARAIAEREEAVARLEGEKTSLEKLLAMREKEQAQEVSLLVDFRFPRGSLRHL
jgi:hypothetical protein